MDTINNKNTKHSIKFLFRTVVAIVMSVLLSSQAMAALYATGGGIGSLSALYTVDPSNGASSLVWNFPSIHIYAGGLAYDNTTDTLYATGVEDSSTGTSRLFAIDRHTGTVTAFAGLSSNINISSGGLAIDPVTGVMYATGGVGDPNPNIAHQSTGLLTIDKHTGAATLVGYAAGNCCDPGFGVNLNGLGFRSDGTLFANGFALGQPDPGTSHLYTVNLATGGATDIGPSGVFLGRSLSYSGLAFSGDGSLLSMGSLDAASGALYSINPATGAATLLGPAGLPYGGGPIHFGEDGGLAFAPAVPEPETYAMLLAGLSLIGFIAYRRKNNSSNMLMAA
jgi:hypothetical protein